MKKKGGEQAILKRTAKDKGFLSDKTVEKIVGIELNDELSIDRIKLFSRSEDELNNYIKNINDPYVKIILILTHKQYKEKEAKALWNTLLIHMQHLEKKLGRKPVLMSLRWITLKTYHL